jgi:hypothetical protein
MKPPFARCVLTTLFFQIAAVPVTAEEIKPGASSAAPAQHVPESQPDRSEKGDKLAALKQKLLGTWQGGACVGSLTFNPDGSFERHNFTPGNNTIGGTWSLRWDALPPTLVLTCKTSDFKKKDPDRQDYVGKVDELKLFELNGDAVAYRFDKREFRYKRRTVSGGANSVSSKDAARIDVRRDTKASRTQVSERKHGDPDTTIPTQKSWHPSPPPPVTIPGVTVLPSPYAAKGMEPIVPWDVAQQVKVGLTKAQVIELFRNRGHRAPADEDAQGRYMLFVTNNEQGWEVALRIDAQGRVAEISYKEIKFEY